MKCPQCTVEMIASPLPDERAIVKGMVEKGSQNAYAANKAATMKEKEAKHGTVVVCPNCRYVSREKADTVAENGEGDRDRDAADAGKQVRPPKGKGVAA